jgi:hypothetical protein
VSLVWRVRLRLHRPPLPSPQQAQAPGAVDWLVVLYYGALVVVAQHLLSALLVVAGAEPVA